MSVPDYIQYHMPDNICFGCGTENPAGLQIKSFLDGDFCRAIWHPQPHFRGWPHVLNGGIVATLIDCHSMATALSAAYTAEQRLLGSAPVYRFATGTLAIRYLKPTSSDHPVELQAQVVELKGRKVTVRCAVFSNGEKSAEADVIAIRVQEGDPTGTPFGRQPEPQ